MKVVKQAIHRILNLVGYDIHRLPITQHQVQQSTVPLATPRCHQVRKVNVPDRGYYQPFFSPWCGLGEFSSYYGVAEPKTLCSAERCWVIYSCVLQSFCLDGEVWECGVYKGGTAAMIAHLIADRHADKTLRLFDTFEGMPDTNPIFDAHCKGNFADTSIETVRDYVGEACAVSYHKGFIPDTFQGLEDKTICFAHIDVDIRKATWDCCDFIFPRLCVGGFLVIDDYGSPSCPGARSAVDSYFSGSGLVPLVLPTGQAVVFKSR